MESDTLSAFFREIWLSIAKSIGVFLPGFIAGLFIYYFRDRLDLHHIYEGIDIVATFGLAITGWICLKRSVYLVHGRLALFTFTFWALGSLVFRIAGLFDLIDSEQRLLGNTIVAIILVVFLNWFIWVDALFDSFIKYLADGSIERQIK